MTPEASTVDEVELNTEHIIDEIESRIEEIEHTMALAVDQMPRQVGPRDEETVIGNIDHATQMAGLQARRDVLYDHLESFQADTESEQEA